MKKLRINSLSKVCLGLGAIGGTIALAFSNSILSIDNMVRIDVQNTETTITAKDSTPTPSPMGMMAPNIVANNSAALEFPNFQEYAGGTVTGTACASSDKYVLIDLINRFALVDSYTGEIVHYLYQDHDLPLNLTGAYYNKYDDKFIWLYGTVNSNIGSGPLFPITMNCTIYDPVANKYHNTVLEGINGKVGNTYACTWPSMSSNFAALNKDATVIFRTEENDAVNGQGSAFAWVNTWDKDDITQTQSYKISNAPFTYADNVSIHTMGLTLGTQGAEKNLMYVVYDAAIGSSSNPTYKRVIDFFQGTDGGLDALGSWNKMGSWECTTTSAKSMAAGNFTIDSIINSNMSLFVNPDMNSFKVMWPSLWFDKTCEYWEFECNTTTGVTMKKRDQNFYSNVQTAQATFQTFVVGQPYTDFKPRYTFWVNDGKNVQRRFLKLDVPLIDSVPYQLNEYDMIQSLPLIWSYNTMYSTLPPTGDRMFLFACDNQDYWVFDIAGNGGKGSFAYKLPNTTWLYTYDQAVSIWTYNDINNLNKKKPSQVTKDDITSLVLNNTTSFYNLLPKDVTKNDFTVEFNNADDQLGYLTVTIKVDKMMYQISTEQPAPPGGIGGTVIIKGFDGTGMMAPTVSGGLNGEVTNILGENNHVVNTYSSSEIMANGSGGTLVPLVNGLSFVDDYTGKIKATYSDTSMPAKVEQIVYDMATDKFLILYDGSTGGLNLLLYYPTANKWADCGMLYDGMQGGWRISLNCVQDSSLPTSYTLTNYSGSSQQVGQMIGNFFVFTIDDQIQSVVNSGMLQYNIQNPSGETYYTLDAGLFVDSKGVYYLYELDYSPDNGGVIEQYLWKGTTFGQLNLVSNSVVSSNVVAPSADNMPQFIRQWVPATPIICNNSYTNDVDIQASQIFIWNTNGTQSLMQIQSDMNGGSTQVSNISLNGQTAKSIVANAWNNNPENQSQTIDMILQNNMVYSFQINWGQMNSLLPSNFFSNPPANDGTYNSYNTLVKYNPKNCDYVISSESTYDIFGFSNETGDMWAIATPTWDYTKYGLAYNTPTKWILAADATMQVTTLKGAENWNTTKTIYDVSPEDLASLIYNNNSTFYNDLAANTSADNFSITMSNQQGSAGSVQLTIKLNRFINDLGEQVTVSPGQELVNTITLTNFMPQQPTSLPSTIDINANDGLNPYVSSNQSNVSSLTNQIQQALNNPSYYLPKNFTVSNIQKTSGTYSSGSFGVTVDVSPTYDSNGNITTVPQTVTVNVSGYGPYNTTYINNPIISASDISMLGMTDDVAKQRIAEAIQNNQIFSGQVGVFNPTTGNCDPDSAYATLSTFSEGAIQLGTADKNWSNNTITYPVTFPTGMIYTSGSQSTSPTTINITFNNFQVANTALTNSKFTYNSLWPNTTAPALDASTVSEAYFKDMMVAQQSFMFKDLKRPITASDITFTNYPSPMNPDFVVEGKITLSFTLPSDASTTTSPFTYTITGFNATKTTLKSADGTYPLGDANKPAIQVTQDEIQNKIAAEKDQIISNLPPSYDWNSNVTFSGFDNTKAGQVTINVHLKGVNTPSGTLDVPVTITGYKTEGLTTTLDASQPIALSGVNGILASDVSSADNLDTVKGAILTAIRSKLQNLNTGVTPDSITNADLTFDVVPNSANNATQSVQLVLHLLNNKAWLNGLPQENFDFNNAKYTFTGFKQQTLTSQKDSGHSLTVTDPLDKQDANVFDNAAATKYLQDNINNIFDGVPAGTTITNVQSVPDVSKGSAKVTFTLSNYYNDKGEPANKQSKTYTVTVDGFNTADTTLVSSTINVGANTIYSIDTNTITKEWIKSKFTEANFKNLPSPYNLQQGLTVVSNISNSWNDPSVAFGTIKFTIQLTGINTSQGSGKSQTFDVTFTGFKTTDDTTTLANYENTIGGGISNLLPSQINASNLSTYSPAIAQAMSESKTAIFNNMIPNAKLSANDITITGVSSPINKDGSIVVNGTLSKNVAWSNGIKQDIPFTTKLLGFMKATETTWTNKDVVGVGLENTYVLDWTTNLATQYIKEHQSDFFNNVPSNFNFDKDAKVTLNGQDDNTGTAIVNIELNNYNDADGNPKTSPAITKTFTISGFKQANTNKTIIKQNALKNVFGPGQAWDGKSPFTADIMHDDTSKNDYANALKNWLNTGDNAKSIFNNYSSNGTTTQVSSVTIAPNPADPDGSVKVTISCDNAWLGDKAGPYKTEVIIPTKKTPPINVSNSITPDEIHNIVQQCGNDVGAIKDKVASKIYNALKNEVDSQTNGQNNYPNEVRGLFNNSNKSKIMNSIKQGIKVNVANDGSNKVSSITFDPTPLVGGPGFADGPLASIHHLKIDSAVFNNEPAPKQEPPILPIGDEMKWWIFVLICDISLIVIIFAVVWLFIVRQKRGKDDYESIVRFSKEEESEVFKK